jgi:hypothetical protein
MRAGLLPVGKLREIARLREAGPVVMVGHGINDAPALATASVGVDGRRQDVALETADVALLRERVAGVAQLVGLSRSTLAKHPAERRRGTRVEGDLPGDDLDGHYRAVARDPREHRSDGARHCERALRVLRWKGAVDERRRPSSQGQQRQPGNILGAKCIGSIAFMSNKRNTNACRKHPRTQP